MTIVVSTTVSRRLDRVVNDICALQHDTSAAAKARAMRWTAHVLNDVNSRCKWWFLQRAVNTMLAGGEDVVQISGHIDKLVSVYAGRRLNKTSLAHITELRQAAAASGRPNAGAPQDYAVENTSTGLRVHLWPAPAGSSSLAATADAGSDQLLVPSTAALTTGLRVRLSTTGTLPGGLAADATYYVIRVNDTNVKLATSLANAIASTAIDITDTGTGTHTVRYGLTAFAVLYTRPMDLAIVPNLFETLVLNGVLGTFGRHFDRDQLADSPEEFERRYEKQIGRANVETWDLEKLRRWDAEAASENQTAHSESAAVTDYLVPASLSGIGYVTIETGDYPLVVS